MSLHTRHSPGLNRRTAFGGIGVAVAILSFGQSGRAAATTENLANHPIVGAWMAISQPPPPVPSIFAADGTVTIAFPVNYIDPTLGLTFQGTMLGAWEPISERGIHFTAIQLLSDADGAFVGTFTLEGHPLVATDGQTFTDVTPDARVILRDAANAIVTDEIITGGVTAVRITPGSTIFPEATPTTGTPTP